MGDLRERIFRDRPGKSSKQPEGKMSLFECLNGIASLLNYHRSSGIDYYPSNDGVDRFLKVVDWRQMHGTVSHRCGDALALDQIKVPTVTTEKCTFTEKKVSLGSLEAIAAEIAICRACSLHEQRSSCRAGSGPIAGVRLMLVGDWLRCSAHMPLPGDALFGFEEDRMVARMLEAIHLEMDKVFITNTIKCVVPEDCKPTLEDIRTCVTYLHRQIALIEPEIICGMGLVAAKALLGSTLPLSRLRGNFHSLTAGTGKQIPVIVTYHPTFLLENPTMKKAAWADLQSIGKYLQTL